MARWNYIIASGVALREAIDDENVEQTVKCLLFCYKELESKLSEEDKDWEGFDIEEAVEALDYIDRMGVEDEDEEEINDHLENFYDLCDRLGAWICTINEEL